MTARTDYRKAGLIGDQRDRFEIKVDRQGPDDCWPWLGATTSHGYGVAQWDGRVRMAHRIAFLLGVGYLPSDLDVLHSCDNPPCVNPAHLFLGDARANAADMMRKGRGRSMPHRGSANGHSKLTDDQVRGIRDLCAAGWTANDCAAQYGVSPTTVQDIIAGRTWRHLR